MDEPDSSMAKSRPSQSAPFKIIAGHHGLISQIREKLVKFLHDVILICHPFCATVVDPSNKFMITASGNRGWWGDSTRVVIIHSITPHH